MDWFPALTTTGLLALAGWLARNLILNRLKASVQSEFDTKLEKLRGELRKSEEQFKADLRRKEADIEALRSGAMNAMASRQMALDARRLKAVDELWSAVTALGPLKAVSSMLTVVKFEESAQEAQRNPQFRKIFEAMGSGFDPRKLDVSAAQRARPFVSPVAWATYSAYAAIVVYAGLKLSVLKFGVETKVLKDSTTISALIKAALPHQAQYIDQYGDVGFHYLLDELETKLLTDLREVLAGVEYDKATIERAANIVKLSDQLSQTTVAQAAGGDLQ